MLSLDQGLASMGGKISSLRAPAGARRLAVAGPARRRRAARWRRLPASASRCGRASRLIVVGDLRVPAHHRPAGTRRAADARSRSSRAAGGVHHRAGAEAAARALRRRRPRRRRRSPPAEAWWSRSRRPTRLTLVIALDKDFGTFRAATVPIDAASSRIVIDLMAAGAPASRPGWPGRRRSLPPPLPPRRRRRPRR